jgi:hypothetical protein
MADDGRTPNATRQLVVTGISSWGFDQFGSFPCTCMLACRSVLGPCRRSQQRELLCIYHFCPSFCLRTGCPLLEYRRGYVQDPGRIRPAQCAPKMLVGDWMLNYCHIFFVSQTNNFFPLPTANWENALRVSKTIIQNPETLN